MMRVEDALRKIRLLRRVVPHNGASEFEANTAAHLVQTLMERYSIGKEDIHPVASPRNRMTWVYWEQLLRTSTALDRFGGRASASLETARVSSSGSQRGIGKCSRRRPKVGELQLGIPAWNLCVRIWPRMVPDHLWRVRNGESGNP